MVIVKTPMLVPLLRFIEEGSDKLVALSLCIDKFIYTIFKERFDTDIYLNTSEKERVSCADDLKNNIVRSALQEFDVKHGVEITFLSDIPTAQSLEMGTRAAFATSLVHGLSSFTGHLVSSEDLARLTFGILSPLEDSPWLRHEVDAVSRGLRQVGHAGERDRDRQALVGRFLRSKAGFAAATVPDKHLE